MFLLQKINERSNSEDAKPYPKYRVHNNLPSPKDQTAKSKYRSENTVSIKMFLLRPIKQWRRNTVSKIPYPKKMALLRKIARWRQKVPYPKNRSQQNCVFFGRPNCEDKIPNQKKCSLLEKSHSEDKIPYPKYRIKNASSRGATNLKTNEDNKIPHP